MKLTRVIGVLCIAMSVSSGAVAQAAPVESDHQEPFAVGVDSLGNEVEVPVQKVSESANSGLEQAPAQLPAALDVEDGDDSRPDSIIGDDGRSQVSATSTFPSSAIVQIRNYGKAHCTGWMVSPDTLVTAGHCLYDPYAEEWYDNLTFFPGVNGTEKPFGQAALKTKWVSGEFRKDGDPRHDWAVVKLDRKVGYATGWFGVRSQSWDYGSEPVEVRGYPRDKAYGQMWSMQGRIAESYSNQLCYEIDTAGGQSGSPVYQVNNGQVIAIHTHGTGRTEDEFQCGEDRNGSTRITPALFDFIMRVK